MRKIEEKAQAMAKLGVFACPVCGEALTVSQTSLLCANGHRYDLAKKGTVNFLAKPSATEYDTPMLEARRRVLQAGFFAPFVAAIQSQLGAGDTVLDVGCGEGTPTARLAESGAQAVGFDISAPAIALAGRLSTSAVFCVADLARLPFLPGSFSAVVDLFSPGAYQEFDRVLRPEGRLFKVIPAAGYLRELRQGLYAGTAKAAYSNQAVLDRFLAAYPGATQTPLTYDFPVSPSQFEDVMKMTPLTWQADPAKRTAMAAAPPASIHVDVLLLEAKLR
ncbi:MULTISPECIES: methyltransferase domain-containing protein [unclassified Lacticaseibacillus]|uniref:methyltransferase domain-containing protein n=1 Tax=unclassified Lacticaseibacillus TaxID=2759744 RepID=UPI001941103D|nr:MULTISPECIES: methyltransferase domain-containing protein [unclassified Lacticaseibacillus]